MKALIAIVLTLGLVVGALASTLARADADAQIQALSAQGAEPFNGAAGESFWQRKFSTKNGEKRSCSGCHGIDPTQVGEHQKTAKSIKPMAVRVNPERFSDSAKSDKWFGRNCRWTLGRECTAQEKGDVMTWLNQY
ncbi:DUF1924 domain-containing protein [Paraglaciecola sp. MB-3u-78]|jgi:hypothetical protein|uniref:DUF1924 domain-containing protein n=1 Tax=Paraglaciecola sp. MB-3u-78 TaxID=2058332 RepID=UPI000C348A5F|nr:DUF1924 domain-containing protein [Paraglaciecola sp. MB-3u-78]PKG92921.1 cytochrome C [Paraglaciecola sp. MB-3u-78]